MRSLLYICLTAIGLLSLTSQRFSNFLAQGSPNSASSEQSLSDFERAVEIIKKYETLHQPRHWPLVGYGHKVLPGESFSRSKALSEKKADELLRKDLLKNCAVFRSYGADSLLLGVLAYNIGSGSVKKSSIVKKLQAGDRDIRDIYISYSKYKGKTHTQLKNRRIEEFESLYIKELDEIKELEIQKNPIDNQKTITLTDESV